jgi:hypothetical protein
MIDLDELIRDEFGRLDPLPLGMTDDWGDVLLRASRSPQQERRGRRPSLAAFAVLFSIAIVTSAVTPLRAAIGREFDDFSAWISGAPGTPASPAEQQRFEAANARSWAAFPTDTQLRKLIETQVDRSTFTLFGFRSGDVLCLRLIAQGPAAGKSSSCAPLEQLQTAEEPALVIASDAPFGTREKPTFGTEYHPILASATFGIASDGVKDVVLAGDDGEHHALISSNAFLFVDPLPKVGARVRNARAVAADGAVAELPIAAAPFGGNGSIAPSSPSRATGPTGVDQLAINGAIGWLSRREQRGSSLDPKLRDQLTKNTFTSLDFARTVQPDPSAPAKIAFLIGEPRHSFFGDKQKLLCVFLVNGASAGGGCSALDELFTHGPISVGVSQDHGSDQYVYVSGAASDAVASLKIFLSNDTTIEVPITENAYAVQVARSTFPARVVAYDAAGRIIGNELAPG